MKTSIFIANAVSAILLLNILTVNPSITGYAVAEETKFSFDLTSPLGFSIIFIVAVLVFDIYAYIKSRKEE